MEDPTNKTSLSSRKLFTLCFLPIVFLFISCDLFNSGSSSDLESEWLIPFSEVFDGGPGKDGIPSVDSPDFAPADEINYIPDERMIIGIKLDDEVRAYPHQILDWHEIVNDQIGDKSFALVYCPLTGTGMCWNREINGDVTEFGVSGLLFRNNLIAYDRNTDSNWAQMQLRSVNGERINQNIETYQVLETNWRTWKKLYPESMVHTTNTGHNRNYTGFTYGAGYSTNHSNILFPVQNRDDRLQNKVRVHGIIADESANENAVVKVYVIKEFGDGVNLIEDRVGNKDYLIVGSSEYDFTAAFLLEAGSASLQFEAVQDQLPVVMKDNEGNLWDVFGHVIEGPRLGDQLTAARSYTGYWFGWADFFPDLDIFIEHVTD
ncbi:DUF3179 domain-containing protein [soil metagenome]